MLIYTLVGVLFGILLILIIQHYQKAELTAGKLVGVMVLIIIGMILVCFSLDWAFASVIEGEPQAAAMGLLVFGGIGVIFAICGWRLGKGKSADKPANAAKEAAGDATEDAA